MIKEILSVIKEVCTSGFFLCGVALTIASLIYVWNTKRNSRKRNKKHQEWWRKYYDWRQEEAFWKTVPEVVLKKRNILEQIVDNLGTYKVLYTFDGAYKVSYTFDGTKIIATIKVNDVCLILKYSKNSKDLFLFYNLINKDKTMSKVADFRTIIDDKQEDFIYTTTTRINNWLKGEWNQWQLK